MNLDIKIIAKTRLAKGHSYEPYLDAGETATITDCLVAAKNPLYVVTKRDGSTFAIHRDRLVECGALEAQPRES